MILVLNDLIFFKFSVDDQFKEVNSHPEIVDAGVFQTDRFGNCVKRDIKFHHSAI